MHIKKPGINKSNDSIDFPSLPFNVSLHPYLLNEKKAALVLGMSEGWMRKARLEGNGPRFFKTKSAVRYRPEDLLAYIEEHLRSSTSDKGK